MDAAYKRTLNLLEEKKDLVTALAEELLEKEVRALSPPTDRHPLLHSSAQQFPAYSPHPPYSIKTAQPTMHTT